ncbi:MAG: dihydroorotate dehydrogenase electron transfer subunit [Eubacterium sp.]|nr:dihydroorotate dehydrogenase electron transfer subunit [Eubacterium sp.]
MSYFCGSYPIVKKQSLAGQIYSYTLHCPEVAKEAQIGQFVQIKAEGYTLRRPISICQTDKERGTLRLMFEVRGGGTDKISELHEGELMDVIAPLGHGFTVPEKPEGKVIVVGGGIGVPPMLDIAKKYGDSCTAILGFRSFDRIILDKDYAAAGAKTVICTDDGSAGVKGTVADPLKAELAAGGVSMIYACGPTPMLKAVVEAAKDANVPCEVSLEQRMGCGVGACVVCACTIKRDGKEQVLRVCKDGPVFKGDEVVF